jgi:O-antigen/teichoic acid export membrane protein
MAGSFIHVVHDNMYSALVGKVFNSATLGYYYRADNFQKLFTNTIDIVIRQVTYPVLSKLQFDSESLLVGYKALIRMASFINSIILLGLFLIAEPLIILLIGIKWLPSVPYLKILCFTGLLFPLISINTNILNVKGRSDLSFKLVALKIIFAVPALILGYFVGIFSMIIGMLGSLLLNYLIAMHYTTTIIGYKIVEQIRDVWSGTKIVLISYTPVFFVSYFLNLPTPYLLIFQILLSFSLLIASCEYSKNKEYLLIKNLLINWSKKSMF